MSILNIDEYATLQRAGFTRAQIAAHQTKFYNLFRVMPLSTEEMRRHRELHKANQELVDALQPFVLANSSEEHINLMVRTSDVTKARAAIAKHGGAA